LSEFNPISKRTANNQVCAWHFDNFANILRNSSSLHTIIFLMSQPNALTFEDIELILLGNTKINYVDFGWCYESKNSQALREFLRLRRLIYSGVV
jgi:hypothetical protein